jgi:transcriptional regulator with XRE-family HTH domain
MHIRLKEFRDRLGLTLEEMAERTTFSVSQLSRWESGNNNIPSGNLPMIAQAYRCRIQEIFDDGDVHLLAPGPQLFVKGSVQAGYFTESWEVPEDQWERYTGRADISVPARKRFGLKVVGESMNRVYRPGTILDCVQYGGESQIPNGKRVIVRRRRFDGGVELTVKEYLRDGDGIEWLVPQSDNPAFQAPFRCDQPSEGIEAIEIIAIVVASIQPE